jgi:hypothetical protein
MGTKRPSGQMASLLKIKIEKMHKPIFFTTTPYKKAAAAFVVLPHHRCRRRR